MFKWILEPIDSCSEDTDRDGVSDCDDKCPQDKRSFDNEGRPVTNKHGDGILDDEDCDGSCLNIYSRNSLY